MLCFSGYMLDEIRRLPLGPVILDHLDVLVAGRYAASRPAGGSLLGSSNQLVHLLTDRYGPADIARVPPRELILHADGSITVSGVAPWRPGEGLDP
jgi:anaerobic ribonucleoside-triphosphate reductase activating protein